MTAKIVHWEPSTSHRLPDLLIFFCLIWWYLYKTWSLWSQVQSDLVHHRSQTRQERLVCEGKFIKKDFSAIRSSYRATNFVRFQRRYHHFRKLHTALFMFRVIKRGGGHPNRDSAQYYRQNNLMMVYTGLFRTTFLQEKCGQNQAWRNWAQNHRTGCW